MVTLTIVHLDHLQVIAATSFLARAQGLIGKPDLLKYQALWIAPCNSVHTCFMGSPIDVVFIGAGDIVVRTEHRLPPWRFAFKRSALSVLELATGQAAALGLLPGCRIVKPTLSAYPIKYV